MPLESIGINSDLSDRDSVGQCGCGVSGFVLDNEIIGQLLSKGCPALEVGGGEGLDVFVFVDRCGDPVLVVTAISQVYPLEGIMGGLSAQGGSGRLCSKG